MWFVGLVGLVGLVGSVMLLVFIMTSTKPHPGSGKVQLVGLMRLVGLTSASFGLVGLVE